MSVRAYEIRADIEVEDLADTATLRNMRTGKTVRVDRGTLSTVLDVLHTPVDEKGKS